MGTGNFTIIVFADLMYGNNATLNAMTQAFQVRALANNPHIDLAVILGNAVDGSQYSNASNDD